MPPLMQQENKAQILDVLKSDRNGEGLGILSDRDGDPSAMQPGNDRSALDMSEDEAPDIEQAKANLRQQKQEKQERKELVKKQAETAKIEQEQAERNRIE